MEIFNETYFLVLKFLHMLAAADAFGLSFMSLFIFYFSTYIFVFVSEERDSREICSRCHLKKVRRRKMAKRRSSHKL